MANESEIWQTNVHPDVKSVLERDFGITTEMLVEKLTVYEQRRDNRTLCPDMNIANEDIARLKNILRADGTLDENASDDDVLAQLPNWTGEMIVKTYAEYEAEGRFATGEEEL